MNGAKEFKNEQQMKIEIIGGRFVISVGIDLACFAVMYGNENNLNGEFEVIDNGIFAKEILCELRSEEEDGTNLIHRAFDKAALKAIENGANGVEEKPTP